MSLRRLIAAGVLATAAAFGSTSAKAALIDLGFVLDGSGSVSSSNYNTARTALSQALDKIPLSGTNQYRIAVISYGSSNRTVLEPTILTADNIAAVKSTVASAVKAGGGTNTGAAITYITSLFANSVGGLGATSLINITTDGAASSQSAAETAARNAHLAGIDGISFEAVGTGVSSLAAQRNMARIAGLGTSNDFNAGVIVSDLNSIPNATQTGFVIPVSSFEGYSAAITAKIGQIVVDTGGGEVSPVPVPAALPLLLSGIAVIGMVRRRRG